MLTIQTPVAKRRRIPLTPLIDVIFILIMFFLLSSSFGVWRSFDVSISDTASGPSVPETAQDAPPPVFMTVRAGASTDELIVQVNGVVVSVESLREELDRLADAGADSALLFPAKGTSFQQVVTVLDAARASKLKKVGLKLQ